MKFFKSSLTVFIVLLFATGCSMWSEDYDKQTIEKAEDAAENYLREEYKDIETVEIEEVYQGEMGGIRVKGTVNNQYDFGLGVEESDFTVGSIGRGFPEKKDDYDKETMEKAEETATSYVENNYKDIETIEIRGVKEAAGDMKVNRDVNTYAFVVLMEETDFTVKDIEIYRSREGKNPPYSKPERKEECKEEDCDY